jgi:hypothetical protein
MGDNLQPQPDVSYNRNVAYPDQIRNQAEQIVSTIKMLSEIPKSIATLRRTFRGEALYQSEDGSSHWIQIVKPSFVKLDPYTREPLMQVFKMPDGEKRKIYVSNDEAIEEILSILFFMGLNQITPLTNLDENTVLDDLREIECKLAGVLAMKQVAWGLDKELLPVIMSKIKTTIQDARYLCVQGSTMKALTQQVSRIEQVLEGGERKSKIGIGSGGSLYS